MHQSVDKTVYFLDSLITRKSLKLHERKYSSLPWRAQSSERSANLLNILKLKHLDINTKHPFFSVVDDISNQFNYPYYQPFLSTVL